MALLYLKLDRAWVRITKFSHNLNSRLLGGILADGWKAGSPASLSSSKVEQETWTLDDKDEHERTTSRMLHATNVLSFDVICPFWLICIASPTQSTGLPRQDWKKWRSQLLFQVRSLAPKQLTKCSDFSAPNTFNATNARRRNTFLILHDSLL